MRNPIMALALATMLCSPAYAENDSAVKFGARESIRNISLSPDGKNVAYIQPISGGASALFVAPADGGTAKAVTSSRGSELDLRRCDWASNTRLICKLFGSSNDSGERLAYSRMIAINTDGTQLKSVAQRNSGVALGITQFDGNIVGFNGADDGQVLMSRTYSPERVTGSRLASSADGLGVDRVDTLTLKSTRVELPRRDAVRYVADSVGIVRIMATRDADSEGILRGTTRYYYRIPNDRDWKPFSIVGDGKSGLVPVAVDSNQNIAYAFGSSNGRRAIFKVSLDGNLTSTIVLASDRVDVDQLLTLGRSERVIGGTLVTDKRETVIFDTDFKSLATRLGKALPGLPLVQFVDASRDESRILMFAGSDTDPGRYFVYDKPTKKLIEIALVRPELEGVKLAVVKPVSYPAADGTMIPGYLTLPPGSATGKGLPTLVMPHGGPAARDEWGFDWLAQYFAAQGFAVLQPNFRGSAGYGDNWFVENGFKSWRIAVGDVNDAGRWLVKEGIADPAKLAIFGWSYGGYAALQSGVLDPTLFKAVVAVAPVTDLAKLVEDSRGFTNYQIVADYVGTGEHVRSGSPRQQVAKISAPVLMFSGDEDLNVDVSHARTMDSALRGAGKASELIVYPGLDHQLEDSVARTDMLKRSTAFLKQAWPTKTD
jgi:dipeptidyl aminopeptidase/acylaminoacyl peptidase